jgi:hypothetical protein
LPNAYLRKASKFFHSKEIYMNRILIALLAAASFLSMGVAQAADKAAAEPAKTEMAAPADAKAAPAKKAVKKHHVKKHAKKAVKKAEEKKADEAAPAAAK